MASRAALSKAELEMARIVWRLGEATVRQVFEALPPDRKVDYKTVQTYLRRLEAKGYLTGQKQDKSTLYRPRVRASQVVRETVEDFIVRLFDGDALPLMQFLIQDRGLKAAEIAKLRTMLNQWEAEQDEPRKSRR